MLMEKGEVKFRRNPRGAWYENVKEVTADGDFQITFHLKAPQPSLLAFLAAGWTAIYPCHVPPDRMRRHPRGERRWIPMSARFSPRPRSNRRSC